MIAIRIRRKFFAVALILVLLIVVSRSKVLIQNVYAEDGWIEISDAAGLHAIRDNLSGNYRLTADIDLNNGSWIPIGSSANPFTGILDGNSKVIRNFVINDTVSLNQGLFSVIGSSGKVINLGIEGANITTGNNAGILAGTNNGIISRCYAKGNITGENYVGGLVGQNLSPGSIDNSFSSAYISGKDYVGGLIGLNSGSVTNTYSSSQIAPSVFNNYLQFDGIDDYISIPHSPAYQTDKFTLEAWFQWDSSNIDTDSDDVEFIVGKGVEMFEIHLEGGSGINGVRFIPIPNVLLNADSYLDIHNAVQPGWFHVAAVYDYTNPGKEARVYINGIAQELIQAGSNVGTSASLPRTSNPLIGNTSEFNIGRRTDGMYCFLGKICDVRFWNVARTAEQIDADKNRQLTGNEPGLIGYWKLDESSGTTAIDSHIPTESSPTKNGTLMNDISRVKEDLTHKGGLIGENSGTVSSSYYDKEISAQTDTGKGDPKSTNEMKDSDSFSSWENFSSVWGMETGINNGYPYLLELAALPGIEIQPVDTTAAVGSSVTFSITAAASDGGTLSYLWERSTDEGASWQAIDGAIFASYNTGTLDISSNNYKYRCKVTNSKNATSQSVYSNQLTLTVAYPPIAGFGKAISFTNSSNISIPSNIRFAGTSDFTISMWFNPDTSTSGKIFRQYAWSGQLAIWLGYESDGKIRIGYDYNSIGGWQWVYGNSICPVGQWSHITMTKSEHDIRLYINGVLDTSFVLGEGQYSAIKSTSNCFIGDGDSQSFLGRIDEVQIYDTALSIGEIRNWMYSEIDNTHPKYSNLLLYYKLNEGSGTVANDLKGMNNGTITNGNWVDSNIRSWTTNEDTPVSGYLVGSDVEGKGNLLYEIITQGTKGIVEVTANNQFTFTPNLNANGQDTFSYRVKDEYNLSDIMSVDVSITPINDPPTGSIIINAGEESTNLQNVTLTLTASDVEGDSIQMCFSNDNSNWSDWEAFAANKSHTLSAGSGNKTVYVKFKDNNGAVSTYSDSINRITYSVTYNGNGITSGSVPEDTTDYNYNEIVTVPGNTGNLIRTGYDFTGWNTKPDGTGINYPADGTGTFTIGADNVVLYANWTIKKYTLTYAAGANGSISGSTSQIIDHGANGTAVTAVPLIGYHFVSWSDGVTTANRTDANITDNMNLTANFAINIYSYNGGFIDTFNGAKSDLWQIMNPDNTLWRFDGNEKLRIYTTPTDTYSNTNSIKNLFYLPLPDGYDNYQITGKISFPTSPYQQFHMGGIFLLGKSGTSPDLNNYIRLEYLFADAYGRKFETQYEIGGTPKNTKTDPIEVAANTPYWVRIRKVGSRLTTFYSTDGVTFTQIADYAGSPLITKYIGFFAMHTNNGVTSIPFDFDNFQLQSLTLSEGGDTTVVNPITNDDVSILEDAQPVGKNIRLKVETLSYSEGVTPDSIRVMSVTGGQLKKADGSDIIIGGSGTILPLTGDYADFIFTPDPNRNTDASFSYVVVDPVFDAVNSVPSTAVIPITSVNDIPSGSVSINSGAANTNSYNVNLTLSAYDVEGDPLEMCFSDNNSTWSDWEPYSASRSYTLPAGEGNITVYVKFRDSFGDESSVYSSSINVALPKYRVFYDGNNNTGGSVPTDGTSYLNNATVTVQANLGNLVREGYTFIGWNTKPDGTGENYQASGTDTFVIGTEDATLYAKWTLNQYTLTYTANANGTITGTSPQTVNHGSSGTAITAVPNEGYHFVSWSDGVLTANRTDVNVIGNINVNATFEINKYTVTFHTLGGGDDIVINNVEHGSLLSPPVEPTKPGNSFIGWYKEEACINKWLFETDTVTENTNMYAKWSVKHTPPPVEEKPVESDNSVDILVNGQAQSSGTLTSGIVDNRTVLTIELDEDRLEQEIDNAENNIVVTIPFNSQADTYVGNLNGQMVKNMEKKQTIIEVQTGSATYIVPAQQINIDSVSQLLGDNNIALEDITVEIEISEPSDSMVSIVENSTGEGGLTIMVPPVEFVVRCSYGDDSVEISSFTSYVERIIEIPAGVDPNRITTGVVVEPDGTVRHVPTKIVVIDGKYYAKINSLTNSTYLLVYNQVDFVDIENHWSEDDIYDMSSRLVISGNGNIFEPDKVVSRGEFAAIIVNALGLSQGIGANPFSDVDGSSLYSAFIDTAFEYSIIYGYSEELFGPMDNITREQAIAILSRVMVIAGIDAELEYEEAVKILLPYIDAGEIAEYAKEAMAQCIKEGIIFGRDSSHLAPKAYLTKAETAAIIRRLLLRAGLI